MWSTSIYRLVSVGRKMGVTEDNQVIYHRCLSGMCEEVRVVCVKMMLFYQGFLFLHTASLMQTWSLQHVQYM